MSIEINKLLEEFEEEQKLIKEAKDSNTYLVREQISTCKICKTKDDLRLGVCFDCVKYVDGKEIKENYHLLWDIRTPENKWIEYFNPR